MSASSVTYEVDAVVDGSSTTCRLCPPGGGQVVASFPGGAPAWRAGQRAHEEAERSGVPHHDHYDPQLDAFLVVRHEPATAPVPSQGRA